MSTPIQTGRPKPDATATFFETLVVKEHEPLLHHTTGTVRLDLRIGEAVERWYLRMVKGDVSVSHRNAKADATVRMDKKLFEGMTKGTVNFTASLLRGQLEVDGDLALLSAFDRLLPGPKRSLASFLERQGELSG
jgi:putative sterol carrier protein